MRKWPTPRGGSTLNAPLQADHLRSGNRLRLLRALADAGATSRAGLAHATGLSVPTVRTILGELARGGLVREAGRAAQTGGRPALRYALDPDAAHLLAVDLGGRTARALRIDLLGRVVGDADPGPTLRPGFERDLLAWLDHALTTRPVAHLALAVPGVVGGGRIDHAPALGWHGFDLASTLDRAFGLPVTLENDVNALATAELAEGVGVGARDVLYVAIGNAGIGAALVAEGRLLRGAHAAAGEIGYAATPRGVAREGILERDLLALADAFLTDGRLGLGSAAATDAFDHFTTALHTTVHGLVCAFDPELLVVAWPADPDGVLVRELRARWRGLYPLRIATGALGPDAAPRGVARLALARLHEHLALTAGRDGATERPHA